MKKKKIHSRNKGCAYERKLMAELREWFPDIKTSRFASKMMDDAGVDFVESNLFQIQAKATEKAPNFSTVLDNMPQDEQVINVVFHKRNRQVETVIMTKKDFYAILDYLKLAGVI